MNITNIPFGAGFLLPFCAFAKWIFTKKYKMPEEIDKKNFIEKRIDSIFYIINFLICIGITILILTYRPTIHANIINEEDISIESSKDSVGFAEEITINNNPDIKWELWQLTQKSDKRISSGEGSNTKEIKEFLPNIKYKITVNGSLFKLKDGTYVEEYEIPVRESEIFYDFDITSNGIIVEDINDAKNIFINIRNNGSNRQTLNLIYIIYTKDEKFVLYGEKSIYVDAGDIKKVSLIENKKNFQPDTDYNIRVYIDNELFDEMPFRQPYNPT